MLLADLLMPEVAGRDFVEGLLAKGCIALQIGRMSGAWPPAARAVRLGYRLIQKAFTIAEMIAWFDALEARVDPGRMLLDWQGQGWRNAPPVPGP